MKRATQLRAVPDAPAPKPEPQELGLYAETRMVARDTERWRRCHEHVGPTITLAERIRSVVRR